MIWAQIISWWTFKLSVLAHYFTGINTRLFIEEIIIKNLPRYRPITGFKLRQNADAILSPIEISWTALCVADSEISTLDISTYTRSYGLNISQYTLHFLP